MTLTSQVSVCAGADVMTMWASFLSGALTAPLFLGIHHAMLWIEGESTFRWGRLYTYSTMQQLGIQLSSHSPHYVYRHVALSHLPWLQLELTVHLSTHCCLITLCSIILR